MMDEKRITQRRTFTVLFCPTWTALTENTVLRGERPPRLGCWNYVKYLFFFKKSTTCTNTTDFIAAYVCIRFKFFFGVLAAVDYLCLLGFKKSTTCTNTTDFIAAYGCICFKFFFGVLAAVDYLCLLGFKYFDIVYSLQHIVYILLKN